jgi:hypothetical protein
MAKSFCINFLSPFFLFGLSYGLYRLVESLLRSAGTYPSEASFLGMLTGFAFFFIAFIVFFNRK